MIGLANKSLLVKRQVLHLLFELLQAHFCSGVVRWDHEVDLVSDFANIWYLLAFFTICNRLEIEVATCLFLLLFLILNCFMGFLKAPVLGLDLPCCKA